MTQPEPRDPREPEVRRFRINETLLGKYGFTENCPGCDWKLAGRTGHREHTEACRDRLHLEMLADEKDKRIIEEEAERMKLHKQERDQDEDKRNTEPIDAKEATAQDDPGHEAEPDLGPKRSQVSWVNEVSTMMHCVKITHTYQLHIDSIHCAHPLVGKTLFCPPSQQPLFQ